MKEHQLNINKIYVFTITTVCNFRVAAVSKRYLGPCQISMMKLTEFDRVLNTSLSYIINMFSVYVMLCAI